MKRLFLLCILIALTLACPGPAGADEVQTPPAPAGAPYEVSLPGGTAADTTGGASTQIAPGFAERIPSSPTTDTRRPMTRVEPTGKERLQTGLFAPVVIGLAIYGLAYVSLYLFFGLVLFVFLVLMIVAGWFAVRSRRRAAMAAVAILTAAGTTAILLLLHYYVHQAVKV